MKKSLSTLPIILVVLTNSFFSLFGQDKMYSYSAKRIDLKGQSEVQEVVFSIMDSLSSVNINIYSETKFGELTIEIEDPSGEKYGNLSLGCQLVTPKANKSENPIIKTIDSDNNEKASGTLSRNLKNPRKGDWKIKIISKSAKGYISLRIIKRL